MGLIRQTVTLIGKDIKIIARRRWLSTLFRAWLMPILYILFIAYVRTFFLPPSHYGMGESRMIRNLTTEVFGSSTSLGGRNKVIFINSGFTNGDIGTVIDNLSTPLTKAGADVQVLPSEDDLHSVCQSSLSGQSSCYAAITFHASPNEGQGGEWSYTARIDAGLGLSVFVNSDSNAAQIYVLPFLQAVDREITRLGGFELPDKMLEQPFTYETIEDRKADVQQYFMGALANYLAVTLFIAVCGITFHLPGYLAVERESGLATLIDVMSHDSRCWTTITARLISTFVSFTVIYFPAWAAIGAVVSQQIFYDTSPAIVIPFHIGLGLSLTAYSLFLGSFFKRSQLSGITALILSLVTGVIAQFAPRTPVAVGALSAVFPSATYTSFAIQLAQWGKKLQGANLDSSPPDSTNSIHAYYFFACLGGQILVYSLLAGVVQRTLHATSRTGHTPSPSLRNTSSSVRLSNVSKTFHRKTMWSSGENSVQAVNGLNLNILRGQLVSLLGMNGSGKSTLLACLMGTQSFSSGKVDVANDQTIALCPQTNVAWDDLTVMENVRTFHRLKDTSSCTNDQLERLISRCDLFDKQGSRPATLSGGQKRKLQLALAFVGDSTLCCIDEASSGLDPISRRKIWDIMLAERGRRTIIFTTHALDEADALADHIAIMSNGQLIAEGSSAELKDKFGGGYRINVSTNANLPREIGLSRRATNGSEHTYPVSDTAQACEVISVLEQLGNSDVSVRSPDIEDVFLNVASPSIGESYGTASSAMDRYPAPYEDDDEFSNKDDQFGNHIQSAEGTGFWKQVYLLFSKRLIVARRNYMPYFCALVIPTITAGLAAKYFLAGFDGIPCTQGAITTKAETLTFAALQAEWGILVPAGPLSSLPRSALPPAYQRYRSHIRLQDNYHDFEHYIAKHFRDVVPGGYYFGANGTSLPLMAYRINGTPGYAALAKNLADQLLSGVRIKADFSTFALPYTSATGDSLQSILYITLALCAYPAFLALYPTYERLRNVRALHYSCGVRPGPLWLAYLLFDGMVVLVTSVLVTTVLTTLSGVWYAPAYLCVALLLYGLCSTMLAYIVSLFSKSLLSAFAFVAGFQAVSMLVYFVSYLLFLTFGSAERLQRDLDIIQFTYGFLTPSGTLFRVMLLALNQSQLLCRHHSLISYGADVRVYGGPYLCFVIQIIGGYVFLVFHDSGRLPTLTRHSKDISSTQDLEKRTCGTDDGVLLEQQRTEGSKDALRLLHAHKRFGRGRNAFHAVEDVTFGVSSGTALALLGPNGAGKSTTMGLIRGDLVPSEKVSDVLISGRSIITDKLGARNQLGVCPQSNSADLMTVKQHLRFYARIRGVRDVRRSVESIMKAVGLVVYRDRLTTQLSGGNQRKLHLATAIVGNPPVLLLDEPSSGMDAVAMRGMWRAITSTCSDRAIVMTTHSMEEAARLANKVVIMDTRLLASDTTSGLCKRYGKGVFRIHIVHRDGASASMHDMKMICDQIVEQFQEVNSDQPGSIMHGQLRLHVALGNQLDRSHSSEVAGYYGEKERPSPLVELLQILEDTKHRFGVEHYSVSPLTLEDVFMQVVTPKT